MDIGKCIERFGTMYVCTNKEKIGTTKTFHLLGYNKKDYDSKFDQLILTNNSVVEICDYKKFVKIENLYEYLLSLTNFKKTKLIGISFDYGDDWYDSMEEDLIAEYIYLYCHGKIIEIAIPQDDGMLIGDYRIPYVHVDEISTEDFLKIRDKERYFLFDETVDIKKLTFDELDKFLQKNEYFICVEDISQFDGIVLNDFILADFDKSTIINIGNGLLNTDEITSGISNENEYLKKFY